MARWSSSNPYVNIDLNVYNIYLSGDWPDMRFHFDCDFNYYCIGSNASSYYNNVNFHTKVTGYETETKASNVSFSISNGQESPRYGANYYNPVMNNARQRTVDVQAWIDNGTFTGGGWTAVASPTVGDPSNLKVSIANITENSCVVNHSFTNKLNYWFVRLWDRNTRTYYNLNGNTGSGTTIITGLSPNTEYKFELWACGRDGVEYTGAYPGQTIKTLGKSSVGNNPTYTIGTNFPLVISGYSDSFTHNVSYTIGAYTFNRTGLRRGTNTITPSTAENSSIYAQMPTITSAGMTISLTTFVNGVSIGANTGNGTVYVNQSNCAPTITSFAYKDVDTISVGLTGNNQYILQNVSKIQVTAITASAKNSATLAKYQLGVSNVTYESSTNTISTNVITNNTAMTVKAIDSRGLQGAMSKNFALFVPYQKPIITEFTVLRRNGVEATSTLSLKASFSLITIANVNKNAISSIKYRYKATTTSTWGALTVITCTINGANVSFANVIGDFNVDTSYNFEIQITDKVGTISSQTVLVVGEPVLSIRDKSIGVNKTPSSGRALDIKGDAYSNNVRLMRTNEAAISGNKLNTNSSMPLTDTGLRYLQGASDTTNFPSADWYHSLRMQHPGYAKGYYSDLIVPFHEDALYIHRINNGIVNSFRRFAPDNVLPAVNVSGAWTWFKFPSGLLIQCFEVAGNISYNERSGTLYYGRLPGPGNYPIAFTGVCYITVTADRQYAEVGVSPSGIPNNVSPNPHNQYYVFSGAGYASGISTYIRGIAIGRWK